MPSRHACTNGFRVRVGQVFASWSGRPADSIEKFEEVGTVFKALPGAIPEAIAFNRALTIEAARFRHLRDRWLLPLSGHDRIRLLTDPADPRGMGFGAFTIDGMAARDFHRRLLGEFDINVLLFDMDEPERPAGLHVSPHLSNAISEIDRFVDATFRILA